MRVVENNPAVMSDGPNKPVGASDRVDSPDTSGGGPQDSTAAFQAVLGSVAFTVLNDALENVEETLADTEENA